MGVMGELGKIVLQNPRVRGVIDKGITDFIDGFEGKKAEATPEQQVELLRKLVGELKKPTFDDVGREEFFEFVLGLIVQGVYLKSRPAVIRDLYAPGYHFYFPQPTGQPRVVRATVAMADPLYAPVVAGHQYYFYAVPADATLSRVDALKALDDVSSDATQAGREIDAALGLAPDSVRAVAGVGVSTDTNILKWIVPHDAFGHSNIKVGSKNPGVTRANVIQDLEDLLNTSTF